MKKFLFANILGLCALLLSVILTGCVTTAVDEPVTAEKSEPPKMNVLHVGDRIKIAFGTTELQGQEHQISDTGTVTLPLIGAIKVAERTIEQVEEDIRNSYVPKYFKHLNVTVIADRYFFVGGEVKVPSRYPYLSGVTVLLAIQTAGDFTDFADRKHVILVRANGKKETINCKKALHDRKLDLPVYPGDSITVPRGL